MASEYKFDFNDVKFLPNETTSVKVVKGGSIYYLPYTTTKSTFDRLFSYNIPSEIKFIQGGVTSSLYRLPMVNVGVIGYDDIRLAQVKVVAEIKNSSGRTLFSKTIISNSDTAMFPVYPGCTSVTYTLSQKNSAPVRIWDTTSSFSISNAPTTRTITVSIPPNQDGSAFADLSKYESIIRYKEDSIIVEPYTSFRQKLSSLSYLVGYSSTNAGFIEENGSFYANYKGISISLSSSSEMKSFYLWIRSTSLNSGVSLSIGNSTSDSTLNVLHGYDLYENGVFKKTITPSITNYMSNFTCNVEFNAYFKESPTSVSYTRDGTSYTIVAYLTGITVRGTGCALETNSSAYTTCYLPSDSGTYPLYVYATAYCNNAKNYLSYSFSKTEGDTPSYNKIFYAYYTAAGSGDSKYVKLDIPRSSNRFQYGIITNTFSIVSMTVTCYWNYNNGSQSYAKVGNNWQAAMNVKYSNMKAKSNECTESFINNHLSTETFRATETKNLNVPNDQSWYDDRYFVMKITSFTFENGTSSGLWGVYSTDQAGLKNVIG